MKRIAMAVLAVLVLAPFAGAQAAANFVAGENYEFLTPAQHTTVPAGKVEVMEVFSYGCIVCNRFQPTMEKLRRALPANAQVVLLPASFIASEDWPMLQRAYFTAQLLGVADRTHQAMFDAVWKSGELAISDPDTHRLRSLLPTIEDAAHCYARWTGIGADAFLAAARSFSVEMKMRAADDQIGAMQVPGTPCIIVNGKYRVTMDSVGSSDELIELVKFLVSKESAH